MAADLALSRYGGLRCPSEHLALTWDDIDLAGGKINVPSPKTAHHAGKESRVIPLFPELRPFLEQANDDAPEGAIHVIASHRNKNHRTRFEKIIKRAGLTPWPKLFHNLRATRETEPANDFLIHVVCGWIGNSTTVAMKHYLQITDEHFSKASDPTAQNCMLKTKQLASELGGNGGQGKGANIENPAEKRISVIAKRSGWDSNPRYPEARRFSRPVHSTTLPPDRERKTERSPLVVVVATLTGSVVSSTKDRLQTGSCQCLC